MDAVLLELNPEYYDLQDHLMKLYIQYKNKEINQNHNIKFIQEKFPGTQFDRYIIGNPFHSPMNNQIINILFVYNFLIN